jgi:hypothetical protein
MDSAGRNPIAELFGFTPAAIARGDHSFARELLDEDYEADFYRNLRLYFAPNRGPNLERHHDQSRSLWQLILSGADSEFEARLGMHRSDFSALFDFFWPPETRSIWSPSQLSRTQEQLILSLFFFRGLERQRALASSFQISQPTVHEWLYKTIPFIAVCMSRWFFWRWYPISPLRITGLRLLASLFA